MDNNRHVDVVVIGSANTDIMARGRVLPAPGQAVDGDLLSVRPGGKGANQAVGVARLGGRVALVSCLGADARGDFLLDRLTREGVDVSHVRRLDGVETGAAVIQVGPSGQKQTMSVANANDRFCTDDVDAAAETIRAARVLLLQLTVPVEAVAYAIRFASDAGVKVILDPGRPERLADELYPRLWAVKPNDTEAEALTGIRPTNFESAGRAADWLLKRGVHAASVQAGSAGNLLSWAGGWVRLPHFPVATVDATGAGDAFSAALAVATVEGMPWEEAGWLASATAALTTTGFGAQDPLPRRDQVEALIREHRAVLERRAETMP